MRKIPDDMDKAYYAKRISDFADDINLENKMRSATESLEILLYSKKYLEELNAIKLEFDNASVTDDMKVSLTKPEKILVTEVQGLLFPSLSVARVEGPMFSKRDIETYIYLIKRFNEPNNKMDTLYQIQTKLQEIVSFFYFFNRKMKKRFEMVLMKKFMRSRFIEHVEEFIENGEERFFDSETYNKMIELIKEVTPIPEEQEEESSEDKETFGELAKRGREPSGQRGRGSKGLSKRRVGACINCGDGARAKCESCGMRFCSMHCATEFKDFMHTERCNQ